MTEPLEPFVKDPPHSGRQVPDLPDFAHPSEFRPEPQSQSPVPEMMRVKREDGSPLDEDSCKGTVTLKNVGVVNQQAGIREREEVES